MLVRLLIAAAMMPATISPLSTGGTTCTMKIGKMRSPFS